MDLDPKILCRVNPQALSVTLWDNTVVGSTNPYGWQPVAGGENTYNPKKSEVTAIILAITYTGEETILLSLTAPQIASYLDNTQGLTLLASDFLGDDFDNFPDGIVNITATMSGTTIGGAPSSWSAYGATDEAFLTFLNNSIRNWVTDIPVPPSRLDDIFDTTAANLILDAIYYNVQYGQTEEAAAALTFLTDLVNSGKRIKDYVEENNI